MFFQNQWFYTLVQTNTNKSNNKTWQFYMIITECVLSQDTNISMSLVKTTICHNGPHCFKKITTRFTLFLGYELWDYCWLVGVVYHVESGNIWCSLAAPMPTCWECLTTEDVMARTTLIKKLGICQMLNGWVND